jgi:hypothetical protein
MMTTSKYRGRAAAFVAALLMTAVGCGDDSETATGTTSAGPGSGGGGGTGGAGGSGGSGGGGTESVCDPTNPANTFSLTIDNEFFPLMPGQVWVYDGMEGATVLHLEITVLNETKMVAAGVETRVVEEREEEDGEIIEISRNWFAQASDGSVCYFGEEVDIYENGPPPMMPSSHDGAWEAGVDGAQAGIIMLGSPMVGLEYDQEIAPGVAQDHAVIVAMGDPHDVPAGMFTDTLETEETTPLEPGATSRKVYASGVGQIIDAELTLTSY